MYLIYSLLLTIAFIVLLPRFLFDAIVNGKYAAGFWQRLGYLPEFKYDDRRIIWLHCVSVGETNAARPLVEKLKRSFSNHRLIISTTTKTGQALAESVFRDQVDAVFYFPFDWKFSVRSALRHFKPDVVLMMETEIWFNFFREAHKSSVKLAIVNGRLSEKSVKRYSYIKGFMSRVLNCVDLALMQGEADEKRILSLGIDAEKVKVTGNLKFDHNIDESENELTAEFRNRYDVSPGRPLIIAASTHSLEEKWLLDAFEGLKGYDARLLIAPRHPERFNTVAQLMQQSPNSFSRRSANSSKTDKDADLILFDSIGELRAVYPLAEIVFVGGSLIPHGGQSILEPASAGKAIVTGPFTANFDAVVKVFLTKDALLQTSETAQDFQIAERLHEIFAHLLDDERKRRFLGQNALAVMMANRGATSKTIENLRPLLNKSEI